MTSGRIQLGI